MNSLAIVEKFDVVKQIHNEKYGKIMKYRVVVI